MSKEEIISKAIEEIDSIVRDEWQNGICPNLFLNEPKETWSARQKKNGLDSIWIQMFGEKVARRVLLAELEKIEKEINENKEEILELARRSHSTFLSQAEKSGEIIAYTSVLEFIEKERRELLEQEKGK